MYKKLKEEEYEKVLKENHKVIGYDSKKYKNFIEAILNNDYFSKRVDLEYQDDYISIFDIYNEIEKFEDVTTYFNKNFKIVFNFCGINVLDLYDNLPKDWFQNLNDHDYDSSINYVNFVSLFLCEIESDVKITLNNKVIFNFSDQIDMNYSTMNIDFSNISTLKDIYENMFIQDYKINGINLLDYFNFICKDKNKFFNKIKMTTKLNNY